VLDSTKEQRANRRHLWSGTPDCPMCHRTVSGAPPDMSGAPGDSNSNSPPSGISRGTRAIIHRTVRCAKEEQSQELASFGKLQRLVRYNSPDCPVCTGLSGVTPEQRLVGANGYLRCIKCAQRAQKSGAPIMAHRTANSTCPVCTGHPGGPTRQKLQRSESNGSDDVAGGTGLSGVHRTVRCAIEQTASQRPHLVVWAINTPTTPPFIASKFSTSQLLQELGIQF
jgi:hypothetical protein